jgi:mannonate dehydratase
VLWENGGPPIAWEEVEAFWVRFDAVYAALVPIAEEYDIKLAMHPSDTPYPNTPLGSVGFHRVIDAFPSRNVGYLYCIGTRAEAGGSSLVLDEIHNYGRKGRLFAAHFRNVRGSLATAGGFEEVLLDDGDMNMFKVLRALHKVGFDGCVNPDHIPAIEGDSGNTSLGLAYSIGYIKALLASLAAL